MLAPLKPLREVPGGGERDKDGLIPLLVFCASRKQCQSCAQLAADLLPAQLGPDFQVPSNCMLTCKHWKCLQHTCA